MNRDQAAKNYLRDALAAVQRNERVAVTTTDAPGCLLGLTVDNPRPEPVTWHNQISRMMVFNCVECHRPSEAAPFALETYQQVVDKKAMIEYVLAQRIMPPWGADHHYGKWRNDRYVSDADKRMFAKWVAAGCTEGDSLDAQLPLKRASGWTISKPDLVLHVEPQSVPAEGEIPWRKFPIPYEVKEDMWVSEAEIRPSVPEVVHHAMLFVEYPEGDPRAAGQTTGESETSGGGTGFWLSYFPGRKSMILPQGRGKLIPKNGRIFIQLHYNPNGEATVDKTQVGFKLLPGPPERAVVSGAVTNKKFKILPNSRAEFVYANTLAEDIRLLALMPHMHYRGSAAQVFLKRPDGSVETLLHVPKYDFDWQIAYELQQPLLVTRGSQIIIRHEFDNRAENPSNPDATQTLVYGDRTTDEMMINFFDWEPAGEPPPKSNITRPFATN